MKLNVKSLLLGEDDTEQQAGEEKGRQEEASAGENTSSLLAGGVLETEDPRPGGCSGREVGSLTLVVQQVVIW